MNLLKPVQYPCQGGIMIRRTAQELDYAVATDRLAHSLDSQRGVLLASSFEFPGRYTRWDIGFVSPPLQIIGRGRRLEITALNKRGEILLPELYHAIAESQLIETQVIEKMNRDERCLQIHVQDADNGFPEELRSRRASVFSVLRILISHFSSDADPYLGFYGAFGYDLTFQFEDVQRYQQRDGNCRDLVLYLPDQLVVADHRIGKACRYNYEFICRSWAAEKRSETTGGYRRLGESVDYAPAIHAVSSCDHRPEEFEQQVKRAHAHFQRGDLFEVVPGQTFYEPCKDKPSAVFQRLKRANPAPYGALINLGEQEYLVAASPEMFVRVDGRQIETCPISGTIRRGNDAIGDADQIKSLLNSGKDESELSMCTDVDRNDKARVCEPGSVEVVGRRQIEMYSRLIHTVDHVKGKLQEGFDALDGFLAHTWAVTVTGAPKLAAMQYIEKFEKSPRHWYGGAIGQLGFNGNLNTGLTLRTVRINKGVAEIRAGATLLIDSDPVEEEQETRLKASALIDAVRGVISVPKPKSCFQSSCGSGLQILMVDHQDSFVHNLSAYFRQCGAQLITLRPEPARQWLRQHRPDLVVLSPGPSNPAHFNMAATLDSALRYQLPVFGVCLGLQGIVEYFGGELGNLENPMHGKASLIKHQGTPMFAGIAAEFTAGRYHSLVATTVSPILRVSASSEDGRVMAVEHRELPISAVQFHPESIMSLGDQAGHRLIENIVKGIAMSRKLTRAV